jgi:transcriptional regulator with XRE-family HTH domain
VTQAQRTKLALLLQRIAAATERTGMKTELANFLGVSRQQLNHWLSGERAPGGEVTLQMLEWVGAEEAQQNKSPGSATNTTRAATRHRQTRESKPTSGRRKK